MRILVGVLGILLSLPWVIAFVVFHEAYPPRQQLGVGALGLVFGACLVVAAGSLFLPAWRRAAVVVLVGLAAFYTLGYVVSARGRRRTARAARAAPRGHQASPAPTAVDPRAPGSREP